MLLDSREFTLAQSSEKRGSQMVNKQLMELVLPRLARRLQRQLERYRAGQLDDSQFAQSFENVLQRQYAWLAKKGVSETQAALAIHGAILVLSEPGLRAEAEELKLPLEVVEYQAARAAAADVAQHYGVDADEAYRHISTILAQYAE